MVYETNLMKVLGNLSKKLETLTPDNLKNETAAMKLIVGDAIRLTKEVHERVKPVSSF